jgi:release factor glutamine methyltransferase
MKDEALSIVVDLGVYPPSEDTYLFMKAIDLTPRDSFLEVGCGAGLITLSAARVAHLVVGSDVSMAAVRNTVRNARNNGIEERCSVVQSDLLTAIHPSMRFSVLAFNPPYLPYDGIRTELDHALVGGAVGTELAIRFVEQATKHMLPSGSIYVVASSLGGIDQVRRAMEYHGLTVSDAVREPLFFEEIRVLRGILPPKRKPFYEQRNQGARVSSE